MDDSCVVCAETLEWVAYGPCGHREVCSTCVARLRFICDDRRCCICKSENSNIFVTKALGDFTQMIRDFSVLPANPSEGQVGSYWYHEGTQAYFDDSDHYKIIKAMCDLSCSICVKVNEQRKEGPKRRTLFKNIEQLKGHLFHQHKLFMCSLCLGGKKVFICEQKLYTDTQLNQHIKRGDSEVDGSEIERGGFKGHPLCEFCRNPFYGENELYRHMSTEHYTCHICQRQQPGQYEYYRDYNDLEIHFRQQHYLCEDETCLAKKFIVFASESEMKRHNAIEHGGNMSRSKRNAALQIPISFRYRRSNEQERHGRGHRSSNESTDHELSLAIQASFEIAAAERSHGTSSTAEDDLNHQQASGVNSPINSFEMLNLIDAEQSSRYCQAVGQNSGGASLTDSSFPPLPSSSRSSKWKSKKKPERSAVKNIAVSPHHQNSRNKIVSSSHAWKGGTSAPSSSATSMSKRSPISLGAVSSADYSGPSQRLPSVNNELNPSSHINSNQSTLMRAQGIVSGNSARTRMSSSSSKISHSASVPNGVSSGLSLADFPPVSAPQIDELQVSNQHQQKVENIHTANKSLVEKIRAALESDKDKYATFKKLSTEFRQDLIDAGEYLLCVHQFGLSHLVPELARLCPDAKKQKELLDTFNLNMSNGNGRCEKKKGSRKGKEKCDDDVISSSNQKQPNRKTSGKDIEVLLKDGYNPKGKSKILAVDEQQVNSNFISQSQSKIATDNGSLAAAGGSKKGGNKQQKKVPKFLRNRLGDVTAPALSHLSESDPCPNLTEERRVERREDPASGLPVRGVWQNGGGRKLVAMTQRGPER